MKRITDFIVDKRYMVLIVFILLSIICVILTGKVNINNDIAKYLPSTSETRRGMDIMEQNFKEMGESTFQIMFKGLQQEEKTKIHQQLEKVEGVSCVDYDDTQKYNKEDYTLYGIHVDDTEDSQIATKVYEEITKQYEDYEVSTNGAIAEQNTEVLPTWIVALAVGCVLIILIIMCESYVEPFLFLIAILIAILLNNGSNIIFESVSNITSSISAILQLALSMDYSIMLMNRYSQEKQKETDKIKAMKNALYNAFTSISSSSLTTIVGLITLVFMSFKIGRDLGLVLAKGVLFSLISIFFVLPALILLFDKWIVKTKKRTPNIHLTKLGKFSYKIRPIAIFLFLGAFVISYLLKGNLGILYTDSQEDNISKIFGQNNQIAIIYQTKDEEAISKHLKAIEEDEKVEQVLGYGNTINEKLTYSQLLDKLEDLGTDIEIEDYLLKILYYHYYNQEENNTMTFDEFVTFIKEQVYNNPKVNEKLDEKTKENIDKLSKFTNESAINQKRSIEEIANILGIEKEKMKDILIYYYSKNPQITIRLDEFIRFMNQDVLTNASLAQNVDANSRESLNKLSKFTSKNTIQKKRNSKEMANLFDMNENTMKDLYTYYISVNGVDTQMTMAEFANFVWTDVLTNSQYASNFNEATTRNIKMLVTFSNSSNITKKMKAEELATLFGIDENSVKQIMLLKRGQSENGTIFSLPNFINQTVYIKNNTTYLNHVDVSHLEKLAIFAQNPNHMNTTKMNQQKLSSIFDKLGGNGFVANVYQLANLSQNDEMNPQEFIHLVVNANQIPETTKNNLTLLKKVIDDSSTANPNQYTATQMAKLLNSNTNQMYSLYALIDFLNHSASNWQMTPNEWVTTILKNSNHEKIKESINQATMNQLQLLSNIMSSTLNHTTYTYQELAKNIGVDENTTKNVYSLYVSKNSVTKMTPQQFVNFVLNHKNDSVLVNNLTTRTVKELNLLQSVMNGVISNKKYTSQELNNLLGIDKNKLNLLYGMYTTKYVNTNPRMSLKELIDFLLNDVLQNPEYANNFEDGAKAKLKTLQKIIHHTDQKYTKDEIFVILSDFTDILDKNTVELLYVYYGSHKDYKEEWTMTVEQFVNFLNDSIIKDTRFTDFIEEDKKKTILDSKESIKEAKDLLIGNGYARIVINTNLELESEETFQWIQKLKEQLSADPNISECYVIGNSKMAYEISQSFQSELDFITIITMIAIFVVVAITFKSVIIPVILVLLIQCAVYMTMGILSFSGEGVYFIALLIVQSILMGATIDYAILYASYYVEHRKTMDVKEAIISSYNKSIHTILTSASILIIVTLIVGHFASAIAAKICKTVSKGTLCSTILILLLLPAVLAMCDKFIIKNVEESKNK